MNGKAVVVTGAAKGIGRACVLRLARAGFRVYAGVRKLDDGRSLVSEGGNNVRPVQMDVTQSDAINTVAEFVRSDLNGSSLCGVVNNAGLAVAGPLEFLPLAELRHQLEVNVIGQVAVTQAFLPMLRQSKGRVVFIGSIAGRSAMPLTGPYSASKFALEAIADALRVELMNAEVDVVIIEPGMIDTPIWQTSISAGDKTMSAMPPQVMRYYGKVINAVRKRASEGNQRGLPPDDVAKVVEEALTSAKPKTRYIVGKDALLRVVLQMLPDRMRDRLIARKLANM